MNREIFPTVDEFVQRAAAHRWQLMGREVPADLDTPLSLYARYAGRSHSFLLESLEGGERWGRYSIIGAEPVAVLRQRGTELTLARGENVECRVVSPDPLVPLRALLAEFDLPPVSGLPRFFGGAVGCLAYDTVRAFERLPDEPPDDAGFPDSLFMIPGLLLVHDNLKNSLLVLVLVDAAAHADPAAAWAAGRLRLDDLGAELRRPAPRPDAAPGARPPEISSNLDRPAYGGLVRRAVDYVLAGDVIQVVLSQRFHARLDGFDPFTLYRALRLVNPSPYLYYLKFDDELIVGSSPELLVRLQDDRVEVRPIAGTRPRGADEAADCALEAELRADPKELAEHIMLVDLGRNDVGRIAEYGRVEVDELMVVERYSHVMHLVSHVQGRLRPGLDMYDAFRACFPAGTVSGAPKVRAMEIIDELEPCRRGPYAGAVGYFGFGGSMDFAIAIRTMMIKGADIYFQAGAGIVADSDPDREYDETVNKARAIGRALELAAAGL
ncbi:MAG: anthranilate synthase component I [Deltaproteobacteria bacterium]|nr:anthranilate synthase component I [Candidatus Anaeroferrophillacea bacterium]